MAALRLHSVVAVVADADLLVTCLHVFSASVALGMDRFSDWPPHDPLDLLHGSFSQPGLLGLLKTLQVWLRPAAWGTGGHGVGSHGSWSRAFESHLKY